MNHTFYLSASLILVVSLGFYLRFMTRIRNRLYGDDCWGLLLWADYLRQKVKISEFYRNFIPRCEFDYPLATSGLLSVFSKRFCERIEPVFSPLVDSINIAIVFILSSLISKSILVATVAALIYALSPALIFNCAQLTARVFGYLIFLISAVLVAYYIESSNFYAAMLSVLFGAVLLNTHKMATQAFVFWLLGLAVLEKRPALLLILTVSLVFAVVISKGYYLKVLRGHIRNLKMHLTAIYSRDIDSYPTESLSSVCVKICFWSGLLFLAYFWNYPLSGYAAIAWKWSLLTYGLFVLMSLIKPLRCLGQGYRYLEYGIAPVAFLLAKPLGTGPNPFLFAALTVLAIIFLVRIRKQNNLFYGYYTNIIDGRRLQIFEFLKAQKNKRIFCLPSGMSMACAYFTRQIILWMPGTEWQKILWLFPYITIPAKVPLTEIIKRYDLDYLLLNTKFAKLEQLNLNNYSKVLEKEEYCLIQVSNGRR